MPPVKSPYRNYYLYHVSPGRNVESILTYGLEVARSIRFPLSVWLVSESRINWAVNHTFNRHDCTKVDIYRVRVQRRRLIRFRRGVWRCVIDVPPWCVQRVGSRSCELKPMYVVDPFTFPLLSTDAIDETPFL